MTRHKLFKLAVAVLVGMALTLPDVPATLAARLANDDFSRAKEIRRLPFSDSVDNTQATTEFGEPQNCEFSPRTVWYSITPAANAVLRADMAGSSFSDTILTVYRQDGSGFGGLSFLGCASFGDAVTFRVEQGATYYLQAGDIFTGGGNLQVNVEAVPP